MSNNDPKRRSRRLAPCLAWLPLLAAALFGPLFVQPTLAQFGGPPFGGRGMGMRGPRPMSAAAVPLSALAMGLKLTAAQKSQIGGIQQQFRQQRAGLMPRGGPPDFGAMRTAMEGVRGLDQSASARIQGILTGPQRLALPPLLRTMEDLRAVGIPAETYAGLRLTAAQKMQIATLSRTARAGMRPPVPGGGPPDWQAMRAAREQTAQKAMSLLTAPQQAQVRGYKAAHPRPGRDFGPPPGGFGPPPPSI